MQVRNMLQKDIKSVAELEKQCFSQPWSENSLKESLESKSYYFLVAEEVDEVIGYMGITIILEEADVTNIAVNSKYRRQGIAETLIHCMFQDCKQKGIQAMTLEVRVSNEPAIQLYKKMGFCSAGIRKNFYQKPIEDAMIMWKYQL